jgi:hypothetical protein
LLPNASIQYVESGHFPHLELPPSTWMPEIGKGHHLAIDGV